MSDSVTVKINAVMDSSGVISNLGQIQKKLQGLSLPKDLTSKTIKQLEELKDLTADYQNLISKPPKTKGDFIKVDQLRDKIHNLGMELEKSLRDINIGDLGIDDIHTEKIDKMRNELEDLKSTYKDLIKNNSAFKTMFNGSNDVVSDFKKLEGALKNVNSQKQNLANFKLAIETGDLVKAAEILEEISEYVDGSRLKSSNKNAAQQAIQGLTTGVTKLKSEFEEVDSEIGVVVKSIREIDSSISAETATQIAKMATEMRELGENTRASNSAMDAYNNSVANAAQRQSEMNEQVQNLQNQVKNYFGLDEIFRRIGDLARDAMETVKELDAAMTQTAVVTNFDVGDMWDKLPEYTATANQLGSTIADVYNATTLYYQQGLDSAQAMGLATETLKMARIAGIEASEATDMMTASLRGFNMEINQTSAQKVNDVYSKLAAITAADTKEIGSAMERTASIANSANMDFETTSAFLSQMIETTREAPENLGTAMKSIIARFQEMKVDPNTLIDSEGEALDFNRVDKALKSIGVSLTDANHQFRDLDDVFLEISSRWSGLSQAQQRYIATIAAGSRQQSRFIAMMQDYSRTVELVDAAYSAEGAGQAQFEKTLESMDTKLNKLKNAWDQFTMGLMNSDFLKFGVDAGTKFLTIVEELITGISKIGSLGIDPFGAVIKSALTATSVFGGLLAMSKVLMVGIGKFAGMAMGESAKDATGVWGIIANRQNQKTQQKKEIIAQYKAENKFRQDLARREFYNAAQQNKGGFMSSMFAGRKAQNQFNQAFRGAGLGPTLGREFMVAAQKANLDQAGVEAARKFAQGISKGIKSKELGVNEAIEKMKAEAERGFSNKEGINVPLELDTEKLQAFSGNQLNNVTNAFNKIGASAQRAGAGISSFGMTLYGTPLQPFGAALDLVGRGITAVGTLSSAASGALKAFQGAMILGQVATKAETSALVANEAARIAQAEGISLFTAVQKLATLGMEEGAAAAYAESVGMEAGAVAGFEMAAGEAAAAAGAGGIIAGIKGITAAALSSPLMPFVVALMAIAAAGTAIYFAATKSARELEAQGDAAARASQDLDTTKQSLEAINNDLEQLADNDTALDGLIVGTAEWNSKLAESNAHILEMMKNYKSLNEIGSNGEYRYIKTDENGRMSITEEGQKAIQKEYQRAANLASANSIVQSALYNNLQDKQSNRYLENQNTIAYSASEKERRRAQLENENINKQNEARENLAWKTGIHSLLTEEGIATTDAVETILASQKDLLVESAKVASGKKEQKEQFAELMDYEYIKDDIYKDSQGNELTIEFEDIKEELPELQALDDARAKAAQVEAGISAAQNKLAKSARGKESTFNTEAEKEGIDGFIQDVLSNNIETNKDALRAFLQGKEGKTGVDNFINEFDEAYNERDAQILESLTGAVISNQSEYENALSQLQDTLETNANNIIQQQVASVSGVAGALQSAGWKENAENQEKAISRLIQKMSNSQIESLNRVTESMSDNIGTESSESYVKTMAKFIKQGKSQSAEDLQGIMDNVDFTNSLSVLEGFNKAANNANKNIAEYGKKWKETGDAARVTASALQEVYSSEDFMALSEEMSEIIKEQGSLDASNIQEMAKESQSLQRYLDATGASATGVARAFTLIGKGKLSLSDLTPGVVAAANAMDKLSSSVGRAKNTLDELGVDFDSGEYEDFLTGQRDALQEMIDNGEYGNEGLKKTLTEAFGSEAWTKAYSEGASGIKKLYNEYNDLTEAGIKNLYKEGMTVEEILSAIQKEYGVTAEYADILLQSTLNTDVELQRKLSAANPKEMRAAYQDATGISSGAGFGSAGDLAAQAQLYSDSVDSQRNYLKNFAKEIGVSADKIAKLDKTTDVEKMANIIAKNSELIASFDSTSTGKEVNAALNKDWRERNEGKGRWWTSEEVGAKTDAGTYDLKAIVESAERAGASNTQALETAYEIAKRNYGKGDEFSVGGTKFKKEDLVDYNAFATKYQEAIDNAQWETVGKTIGQQIVDAWYNRKITKEKEEELTPKIQDWNTTGGINEKSNLFKWFSSNSTGQAVFENLENMSEDATQRENHEILNTTLQQLAESNMKMADSTREGFWKNIINQSGGEALGVGKAEGGKDVIVKNSDELAAAMGRSVFAGEGTTAENLSTNLASVYNEISSANKETQTNVLSTYLSQFQKDFQLLNPEEQANSLNSLVDTLNGWNLSPDTIAAAVASLTGKTGEEGGYSVNGEAGSVELDIKKDSPLYDQLDGLKANIEGDIVALTLDGTPISGKAKGQNNPNSVFHTGTMAQGSGGGYTISGRPTLTGEEGPEVVWEPKQNSAYIVGEHGPQFANISKNATVWNAKQTKKIKKNSGSIGRIGTGARGITPVGTMNNGTKGSGKKGSGGAGLITIGATANIVEIQGEPVPVDVKPNFVVGKEKGGLGGLLSSFFGGDKNSQTIPLKGVVKKKDLELPENAKIKVAIKVTGQQEIANATESIHNLQQISGTKVKVSVKSSDNVNEGAISNSIASAGQSGSAKLRKSLETAGKQANFSGVTKGIASAGKAGADSVRSKLSGISATASITPKLTKSSLSVKGNKGGSATVSLYWSGAQGFNNYKLGSYATGKRRNQAGAALTGEEGPEMAWYPSQQRAELLGVGGPQFIRNLPKDAVIWSAQQTEEIMKRRSKAIGSFATGKGATVKESPYNYNYNKGLDKAAKALDKQVKAITDANYKIGTYASRVYDITKKTDKLGRDIERTQNLINDFLENNITDNFDAIRDEVNSVIQKLNRSIDLNTNLLNRRQSRLESLDKGSAKKVKFTYKGNKKGIRVRTGKFINQDPETGEYMVNREAISNFTNGGKIKGKKNRQNARAALTKKIEETLDKAISNRNSAEDELAAAQEKLKEFAKQLKESLYDWQKELTEIERLQDRIDLGSSFQGMVDGLQELILNQASLTSSFDVNLANEYINAVERSTRAIESQISSQWQLVKVSAEQLKNNISAADEVQAYEDAKARLESMSIDDDKYSEQLLLVEALKEDIDSVSKAREYISVKTDELTGASYVEMDIDKMKKDGLMTPQVDSIKEYAEKVSEGIKGFQDEISNLTSTINSLYEKRNNLTSEMSSTAQTLLQGRVAAEQKEINQLSEISSSIHDGFSDLIDSVRKELEKQRQLEQNEKTEQDISNQMNRLAMLRADTSGGNAAEIAQLEKEIAEATGEYEDSLEDQMLDNLQNQADEAAQQRERQIEIMNTQLQYVQSTGQYLGEIESLLKEIDANGLDGISEEKYEELLNYWLGGETLDIWSKNLKESEFGKALTQAATYSENIESVNTAIGNAQTTIGEIKTILQEHFGSSTLEEALEKIKERNDDGSLKHTAIDAYNLLTSNGYNQQKALSTLINEGYSTDSLKSEINPTATNLYNALKENSESMTEAANTAGLTVEATSKGLQVADNGNVIDTKGFEDFSFGEEDDAELQQKEIEALEKAINETKVGTKVGGLKQALATALASGQLEPKVDLANGKTGYISSKGVIYYAVKDKIRKWDPDTKKLTTQKYNKKDFKNSTSKANVGPAYKQARQWHKNKYGKYLSGGLADYTGPAWLDGSPSKPELILSATDTKNFLALKDVLSEVANSGALESNTSNSTGDMNFEININVDSISNDYDVDRIAERIKKDIVRDAKFRNVNAVSRFR